MKKQKIWWLSSLLFLVLCSCGGNKSELVTKDWKATEVILGGTKLSGDDLGGLFFSFKPDSTFTYTETGNSETGKWNLNKEGNQLVLKYTQGDRTVVQDIKELTAEKLVVNYEDHGMKRSVTLVPKAN